MVSFLTGARDISLHQSIQIGSGAHQASYSKSTRSLFPGVKQPVVKMTNLPHLVLMLRMNEAIPSLHLMPSWRPQEQLYFYIILGEGK
jgi:hypothetical protein